MLALVVLGTTSVFAVELSKSEINFIENTISKNYIAFDEWLEKGYKKDISKIKNTDELTTILNKYVDDRHFFIRIAKNNSNYAFRQDHYCFYPKFDIDTTNVPDSKKYYYPAKNNLGQDYVYADFVLESELDYYPYPSTYKDSYGYYEQAVGNNETYYIRIPNCNPQDSKNAYINMGRAARKAVKYKNIILDFHNNSGGGVGPQRDFLGNLINEKYKGHIYIIQDYNSCSAAESWWFMTGEGYTDKLNCSLIGTNSGGMKRIAAAKTFQNSEKTITLSLPQERYEMSEEYNGEGWGYFPQVWSLMKDLSKTFKALNVNVEGIDFFKCEPIGVFCVKQYDEPSGSLYDYYYTKNCKAGEIGGYGIHFFKTNDNRVFIGARVYNPDNGTGYPYNKIWDDPYGLYKNLDKDTFIKLKSFFENPETYQTMFEEENEIFVLIEKIYNE